MVDTVVVGCNLPSGLRLRLWRMVEQTEPTPSGTRTFQIAEPADDKVYVVRGNAVRFGDAPAFPIIGGYALTADIPAPFWQEWVRQNEDSALVKQWHVFGAPSMREAQAIARAHEQALSGLEPIDPLAPHLKDPSIARGMIEKAVI
jgi:hypothetical protein